MYLVQKPSADTIGQELLELVEMQQNSSDDFSRESGNEQALRIRELIIRKHMKVEPGPLYLDDHNATVRVIRRKLAS